MLLYILLLQQHLYATIYYFSPSTVTAKFHMNYLNTGRASEKPFPNERSYFTGNFTHCANLTEDEGDGAHGLGGYLC